MVAYSPRGCSPRGGNGFGAPTSPLAARFIGSRGPQQPAEGERHAGATDGARRDGDAGSACSLSSLAVSPALSPASGLAARAQRLARAASAGVGHAPDAGSATVGSGAGPAEGSFTSAARSHSIDHGSSPGGAARASAGGAGGAGGGAGRAGGRKASRSLEALIEQQARLEAAVARAAAGGRNRMAKSGNAAAFGINGNGLAGGGSGAGGRGAFASDGANSSAATTLAEHQDGAAGSRGQSALPSPHKRSNTSLQRPSYAPAPAPPAPASALAHARALVPRSGGRAGGDDGWGGNSDGSATGDGAGNANGGIESYAAAAKRRTNAMRTAQAVWTGDEGASLVRLLALLADPAASATTKLRALASVELVDSSDEAADATAVLLGARAAQPPSARPTGLAFGGGVGAGGARGGASRAVTLASGGAAPQAQAQQEGNFAVVEMSHQAPHPWGADHEANNAVATGHRATLTLGGAHGAALAAKWVLNSVDHARSVRAALEVRARTLASALAK